jgi:hypothetical protein
MDRKPVLRRLISDEFIERRLRAAPDADFVPGKNRGAGGERALRHVARADNCKLLCVLPRQPSGRDGRGGAGSHHRVIGAVADRQRKSGFRVRIDQDRYPFAGGGFRFLDVRGHRLPFARIFVEHDVPFRVHVVTALAVHAISLLDAAHIFRRCDQPHHVGAAQDQRLSVSPAFHGFPPALPGGARGYDGMRWGPSCRRTPPKLPMRLGFGRMNLLQTLQEIDSADGAAFAESSRGLLPRLFGILASALWCLGLFWSRGSSSVGAWKSPGRHATVLA